MLTCRCSTWSYKPPLAAQIPERFDVALHQHSSFTEGIMSSKAIGEPPLVLATSAAMAAREAISAARSDAGCDLLLIACVCDCVGDV